MIKFVKLKNKLNTEVILCNVGASIYNIKTPDKNGKIESILYTTKNRKDYPENTPYLGKTIGRTGGRISNGEFKLSGKIYKIPSNDPNGLHGGNDGLSFKEFTIKKKKNEIYNEVIFYYESKHLESGYPGNLELKVSYKLYNDENKLLISYTGISDEDTLLNLSNHAYFNLSGNAKKDILDHELFINSKKMEKIKKSLPEGIYFTKGIYSFNPMHKIKDYLFDKEIIKNTNGYDFPYFIEKDLEYPIILKDLETKRVLKIKTSYPAVVLYTCNYPGDYIMNNNKKMKPYYAVCLECMYAPNSINSDFIKDKKDILLKYKKYEESIELKMEVEND